LSAEKERIRHAFLGISLLECEKMGRGNKKIIGTGLKKIPMEEYP
jgi:hypothetical protein